VCSKISTVDGRELAWVDEIRYLVVYILRALKFNSIDNAKRSFYQTINRILAKVGRLASEEVSGGARVFAAWGKGLCCRPRQSDQFCNHGIFQDFGGV